MDKPSEKDSAIQSEPRTGHSGGFSRLLWFLVFLFGYVLSIGPATKIHQNYPATRPAIEAAYKPVTLLIDNCRPIRPFFVWYTDTLWKAK